MIKMSFKLKIFAIIITIIFVSILTSYFSANYYISRYISSNDTHHIQSKVTLLKSKIISDIDNEVKLAKSLIFSITKIKSTMDSTGFAGITKIAHGLAFDQNGSIEDPAKINNYIEQLNQADGQVMISDISYQNNIPMINVIIPRSENTGDIFLMDLSRIKKMLEESVVIGSYIELIDAADNVLFSNKKEGDLVPLLSTFDVGSQQWHLNGYIDKESIQSHTDNLNGAITIALLIAAAIIIPLSILSINAAFRPIVSLREVITDLANGSGDLTHRLAVESKDDLGKIASGINQFVTTQQG